jgi:NADPH-dependent curcumin reductase CurA
MNLCSREWRLVHRPAGSPTASDVELVEVELRPPADGEVLVRNSVMSVEPYMWGRMTGDADYAEPYALGAAMTGHAVGTVVQSAAPDVPEGALVLHEAGWREAAVLPAARVRPLPHLDLSPSAWLGVLGLTGLAAYVGVLDIARCRPGDTVFVSAAAGAVGSTAAQIAKAMGCRVIGSAGSAAKVEFLMERMGLDAAFDHRDGPIRSSLSAALSRVGEDGLDVYFDNVGGEHLEAAIRRMRNFGRIVLCGAISTYGSRVPGPSNLLLAIWRRLRLEGFIATDHVDRRPEFERVMASWLREGRVHGVETVRSGGIAAAFPALLGLLGGQDVGKTVVTLAA